MDLHMQSEIATLQQRVEMLERQVKRLEAMQDPRNWNTTLQPDEGYHCTVAGTQFTDPDEHNRD